MTNVPQAGRPARWRNVAGATIVAMVLAGVGWALDRSRQPVDATSDRVESQRVESKKASPTQVEGTSPAALFASPGAVATAVMPRIRVRDSETGEFLRTTLDLQSFVDARDHRQGVLTQAGATLAPLAHGEYLLTAKVPGYRSLAAPLHVEGTRALPVTFWLQPSQPSPAAAQRALQAVECGECSLVAGHAYDVTSGQPLQGLRVTSGRGGSAVTGADGGFVLTLPASPRTTTDPEALPESTTLTVQGRGYRQVLRNVALYHDSHELIVDMTPGVAAVLDLGHVRMHEREASSRTKVAAAPVQAAIEAERLAADRDKALDPDDVGALDRARSLAAGKANLPVPTSIRVGTGCSGRSCTGVSVYGFEDYVGRGLDDEWIASWQAASLAAGAIAYRSYGAYYVANPVNGQYDICSSTSCQVFRSGSASSTIAAASATRNVVLTRDGQSVAFSEYSAENNAWDDPTDGLSCSNPDLSCGDGRNGSPRNGWPCLSDSVGRGRGCFGHGRGMSQWGTQRWAANHGRSWKWIANHYYNGNNNPGGMRNAFLANVDEGGATTMLDNFESGVGHFNTAPTYSGSTTGIAASSLAERDCSIRHGGSCSLHLALHDNASSSAAWSVRLLSGVGNPAANVPLARSGRIGFWIYSGGSGMRVGVGIDDSDGTERSVTRAIPANAWTYVEWALSDAAQWDAWAGGSNGAITATTVKLDAIWIERAQTSYPVHLYVDDVQLRN